ncbi:peroxiredoxin family protein [Arcanobacterium haemolyticum]
MPEQDWRAKIRESRFGTVVVLAVTAACVLLGAWYLKGVPADSGAGENGAASQLQIGGEGQAPSVGAQAPDFQLTTITGETVRLSELKGKPVWVNFVATWCQGCRAEMPDIQNAYAAHSSEELQVVSVFGGESVKDVASYAKKAGLEFSLAPDETGDVSRAYGTIGIPAHFFIDRDGIIRDHAVGVLSKKHIESHLAKIK